jgi:hypothetical protein
MTISKLAELQGLPKGGIKLSQNLIRKGGKQQQLDKQLWECLLKGDSETEKIGFSLTRLQSLIYWSRLHEFVHLHL